MAGFFVCDGIISATAPNTAGSGVLPMLQDTRIALFLRAELVTALHAPRSLSQAMVAVWRH